MDVAVKHFSKFDEHIFGPVGIVCEITPHHAVLSDFWDFDQRSPQNAFLVANFVLEKVQMVKMLLWKVHEFGMCTQNLEKATEPVNPEIAAEK